MLSELLGPAPFMDGQEDDVGRLLGGDGYVNDYELPLLAPLDVFPDEGEVWSLDGWTTPPDSPERHKTGTLHKVKGFMAGNETVGCCGLGLDVTFSPGPNEPVILPEETTFESNSYSYFTSIDAEPEMKIPKPAKIPNNEAEKANILAKLDIYTDDDKSTTQTSSDRKTLAGKTPRRKSRSRVELMTVADELGVGGYSDKRRLHNVLERKRRVDLKISYSQLRDTLPDLRGNERAATGTILHKAVAMIAQLQAEAKQLETSLDVARAQNRQLSLRFNSAH